MQSSNSCALILDSNEVLTEAKVIKAIRALQGNPDTTAEAVKLVKELFFLLEEIHIVVEAA